MTRKKKPTIVIRAGKPSSCAICGKPLHRKSEYYCSAGCADAAQSAEGEKAPPFLSKWKLRKVKQLEDPLIALRQRVRKKTNDLIKRGVLQRGVCVVCGTRDVVAHHEDYRDPYKVIWLCEDHHKDYHEGKIALFDGKLRWDPKRLTEVGETDVYPKAKYQKLSALVDRQSVNE